MFSRLKREVNDAHVLCYLTGVSVGGLSFYALIRVKFLTIPNEASWALKFPLSIHSYYPKLFIQEIQGWGQILSYESIRNEYILDAEWR